VRVPPTPLRVIVCVVRQHGAGIPTVSPPAGSATWLSCRLPEGSCVVPADPFRWFRSFQANRDSLRPRRGARAGSLARYRASSSRYQKRKLNRPGPAAVRASRGRASKLDRGAVWTPPRFCPPETGPGWGPRPHFGPSRRPPTAQMSAGCTLCAFAGVSQTVFVWWSSDHGRPPRHCRGLGARDSRRLHPGPTNPGAVAPCLERRARGPRTTSQVIRRRERSASSRCQHVSAALRGPSGHARLDAGENITSREHHGRPEPRAPGSCSDTAPATRASCALRRAPGSCCGETVPPRDDSLG